MEIMLNDHIIGIDSRERREIKNNNIKINLDEAI